MQVVSVGTKGGGPIAFSLRRLRRSVLYNRLRVLSFRAMLKARVETGDMADREGRRRHGTSCASGPKWTDCVKWSDDMACETLRSRRLSRLEPGSARSSRAANRGKTNVFTPNKCGGY